MKVTRIFTGPDQRSHFEDLEVTLHPARYGELSDAIPANGVIFRTTPQSAASWTSTLRRGTNSS